LDQRRYNALRVCLLLSISVLAFAVPTYAASVATQQTTGHIRIVNGANAGVLVTPSVLDFGSVTWGQTVSQPIIVTNNGDCGESVTATASQAPQTPVILNIPLILPGKSLTVTATYDTSMFGSPGDYSFVIDWTATCL